jgi:ketosteroid isomerase-like protein
MFWRAAVLTVPGMDALQLIENTADSWNNRDRSGFVACYAEDCELTAPGFAGIGHQAVTEFWDAYMQAFPDNHVVLTTLVGGSPVAVEEGRLEGTHTGPLEGADGSVPPSGHRINAPYVAVHTERAGKLVSSRFYFDQLDLLAQIGALPAPP